MLINTETSGAIRGLHRWACRDVSQRARTGYDEKRWIDQQADTRHCKYALDAAGLRRLEAVERPGSLKLGGRPRGSRSSSPGPRAVGLVISGPGRENR